VETIKIGRYSDAESQSHGWTGWIEPESRAWILYIPAGEGVEPQFYAHREKSGAVIGDPATC
jgi:hypothetical protein